jgi:hypothetical protein
VSLLGKLARGAIGLVTDLVVTEVSKRLDDRTRELATEAVARASLEYVAAKAGPDWLERLERLEKEAAERGRTGKL